MSKMVTAPDRAPRFWVVDDDPGLRNILRDMLASQGYEVLTATSGRECLDWLRQRRPDVILLDVVMPELDGLEVCRRIKSDPRLAGIFVALISGLAIDVDHRVEGLSVGADDYIVRPFVMREFLERMRSIVRIQQITEAFRVSEEFLRRLLESSWDCIKVLDLNSKLLSMSRGGQRLLEIGDISPILHTSWLDFFQGEDRNAAEQALALARAGGVGTLQGYCPTATGKRKCWDCVITPILDASGRPEKLLAISRDITEQKLAEEQLRRFALDLDQHVAERTAELAVANRKLSAEIAERKQAEETLRENSLRLEVLSRRLLEVQESERRKIARELHDEIGQNLTALRLALECAELTASGAAPASLQIARLAVEELMGRIQELSLDLRPAMLDHLGLLPALLWHVERFSTLTGVRVDFKHFGIENERFPAEVETTAYRIVQESLTNVARHARVGEAVVRVWFDAEILEVQIEDHGVGFNPEALQAKARAGLVGMDERVRLLSGQLLIESKPEVGTQVTATLPFARAAEKDKTQGASGYE